MAATCAIARVVELPNGMRMLIGRDLGEPERFRVIVMRALAFSLSAMLLVGLLTWILVGRRALTRLEMVSQSTERILSGDRTERLPVSGSGDEFDRLSIRLNAMLDRINTLDEGLRQVSDNIAHDLKTPLARLRNKAEAALAAQDGDQRAVMQEIIGDTDQIIRTFNALLMISRVESGSVAGELTQQDLSSIVEDVAELYQPVAEEAGFEFSHSRRRRGWTCGEIANCFPRRCQTSSTMQSNTANPMASPPRIAVRLHMRCRQSDSGHCRHRPRHCTGRPQQGDGAFHTARAEPDASRQRARPQPCARCCATAWRRA